MMDLDQAKRALEKAAQQLVSQETIEAERDFHKARANLLTVKNDILKQQVHSLLAQRDQLENTLRLGQRNTRKLQASNGSAKRRIAFLMNSVFRHTARQ